MRRERNDTIYDSVPPRVPIRTIRTVRRPDARGKIDHRRATSISFLSDGASVPRGSGRVGALRLEHGAAQREGSPGGQLFRGFRARNKSATDGYPRYCARDYRSAAASRASDGDVSRFTARGPVPTGPYDLPLDLWPSKRRR